MSNDFVNAKVICMKLQLMIKHDYSLLLRYWMQYYVTSLIIELQLTRNLPLLMFIYLFISTPTTINCV